MPLTKLVPLKVSDMLMAFPAHVMDSMMPAMDDIPEEFHGTRGKWQDIQSTWFFSGLRDYKFIPKEGVDLDMALRHLRCIQGSFEPQHEHKAAAVAYLMSLWLEDAIAPKKEEEKNE